MRVPLKFSIIIVFLAALNVSSAREVFAQNSVADVDVIKRRAREVIEAHERLVLENVRLQEERDTVVAKLASFREKYGDLFPADAVTLKREQPSQKALDSDAEALIYRSRNLALRAELLDTLEEMRAKKLKLSEMMYKKRELELAMKDRELARAERSQEYDVVLGDLRQQLTSSTAKVEELTASVEPLERQCQTATADLVVVEKEVKDLQARRTTVMRQKDLLARENTLLGQKKFFVIKSSEGPFKDKELRKIDLQSAVSALEATYADVSARADAYIQERSEIQELMQEIIALDKENTRLRDELEALKVPEVHTGE